MAIVAILDFTQIFNQSRNDSLTVWNMTLCITAQKEAKLNGKMVVNSEISANTSQYTPRIVMQ